MRRKTQPLIQFRVAYLVNGWLGMVDVMEVEASRAVHFVRRRYGATSIRNVTMQCSARRRDGKRCTRYTTLPTCTQHEQEKVTT